MDISTITFCQLFQQLLLLIANCNTQIYPMVIQIPTKLFAFLILLGFMYAGLKKNLLAEKNAHTDCFCSGV